LQLSLATVCQQTTSIALKAWPVAAVGEHQVTLNAEAAGLEKSSQTFMLKVTAVCA
jgi:hypothetical protein